MITCLLTVMLKRHDLLQTSYKKNRTYALLCLVWCKLLQSIGRSFLWVHVSVWEAEASLLAHLIYFWFVKISKVETKSTLSWLFVGRLTLESLSSCLFTYFLSMLLLLSEARCFVEVTSVVLVQRLSSVGWTSHGAISNEVLVWTAPSSPLSA